MGWHGDVWVGMAMKPTDLACGQNVRAVLGADGEGLDGVLQLLLLGQLHQCGRHETGVQPTYQRGE